MWKSLTHHMTLACPRNILVGLELLFFNGLGLAKRGMISCTVPSRVISTASH